MAPSLDRIRVGSAPDSWGVWFPDDPQQVPWQRFLDEVAEAGYSWIELGPYGYLPTDPAKLAVVRRLVLTRRRALRLEGEAHESRAEGREDEHTLDPRSHLDARPAADARVAGRAPDRGEVEVVVGAAARG